LTIALSTRPKRVDRVLVQRTADSMVLLDPESGHYYRLDEVGARIWELCDGSRQVAEVVSAIHEEYEAPINTIEADVLELLGDLAREKLVVPDT
jgi:coenzyme PQQ biosynthesis protein PqqD